MLSSGVSRSLCVRSLAQSSFKSLNKPITAASQASNQSKSRSVLSVNNRSTATLCPVQSNVAESLALNAALSLEGKISRDNSSANSSACPFHNSVSHRAERSAISAINQTKSTDPSMYEQAPGFEGEPGVTISSSLRQALVPLAEKFFPSSRASDISETDGTKSLDDMPGPKGLPGIGNVLMYSKLGPFRLDKVLDNRLTYVKQFGRIYREKMGMMDMVHLFDPTDIATMFRLEGKHPSRGLIANLELTYLQRNNKLVGFAFLDGPEWERQRACIQQLMMKPLAAAEYLRWQWPVAQDFTNYLSSLRDSNNLVTDLQSSVFKYTMESIGAVCFGDRIGSFGQTGSGLEGGALPDSSEVQKLPGYIQETLFSLRSCMFNFPFFRYFKSPMYKRFENASNEMRRIMSKYIEAVAKRIDHSKRLQPSDSTSELYMENNASHDDEDLLVAAPSEGTQVLDDKDLCILKMLMEDPRVSPDLAVNLCMALFRTGIDSTGNALLFFMHNLASNPDKQEELYKEISTMVPTDTPPNIEVLQKLPYLRACLRESFRLNFPVYGGSGRVMPEDTVFSGYKVPKGTFIFANLATMSRMEEYFPKPDEFHPERWLRDERACLQSHWPVDSAFLSLPFSHGLRACPGRRFAEQGIYMAAIAIIQRFRLETNNRELEMINMPFTVPDRSVDIKLVPRDQI